MVKKGGTNLNNVIPPYSGSNNSAVEALNDGVNSDTMHTEMMQNAGSSSSIECPTFTGDPAATDASYLINSTLVENTNNATGDSLTGGKKNKSKKTKSKSKKSKSKSKSKSKKSNSKSKKSKSKSKKSKSKSKKSNSKSKKRV